jgi:hypothetical protein
MIGVVEEELSEDQSGRRPVQEEVVLLDGGAYEARREHLS